MNQAVFAGGARLVRRLLKGVEHEASMGGSADPPPDDTSRAGVDGEGYINEARSGRHVGEIRQPEPVRRRRMELAVHVVERAWRRFIPHGCAHRPAADGAFRAKIAHQALDGAARGADTLTRQLPPHLPRAVDSKVFSKDAGDRGLQRHVPPRPGRHLRRVATPGDVIMVGRWGDLQHLADRLAPMRRAIIVDDRDHGLNRRSSSAAAKYALASRRISLA